MRNLLLLAGVSCLFIGFAVAADAPETAFAFKPTSTSVVAKYHMDKGFKCQKTELPDGGVKWSCLLNTKEGDAVKVYLTQDAAGFFESALCLIDSPKTQWEKKFPQNFFKVFGKVLLKEDAEKIFVEFIDSDAIVDGKKAEKTIADCKIDVVFSTADGKAAITFEPAK